MTYTSPVYATKFDIRANVILNKSLFIGEIQFTDLDDAFVNALKLYNKNANRHITNPTFKFQGQVYICMQYVHDIGNRRYREYWYLSRFLEKVPVSISMGRIIDRGGIESEPYIRWIPMSKVKLPDAKNYVVRDI